MKTLKKVLSVALVLAMAFSLVTFAGAADKVSKYQDFTDAADIQNKEAVDLLTALGVINGMDDGSYSPEGYFTRAQAAKIMTFLLLGEKTAANLKASGAPFADVPATHWAAAYIQFCVTRDIINGVGDNKFDPDGYVTAAQFAKMLLVAAGYGKLGEYVGADWGINVIVDGQNYGILDTDVDYMAPATRDEVARYAFNFYTKVVLVYYNSDKGIYDYLYASDTTLASRNGVAYVTTENSQPIVVNGIPSRVWQRNGVNLTGNAFPNALVTVFAEYSNGTPLSSFTNPSSPLYKAAADTTVNYYFNGTYTNDNNDKQKVTEGTKGLHVKLVDTEGNGKIDTIIVIEKTVAEVQNAPYVNKQGMLTLSGVLQSAKQASKVVGYEGLQAGDIVLHYTDANDVTYIEKARMVTGQLTRARTSDESLTFGGSVYYASGLTGNGKVDYNDIIDPDHFNLDATLWLDDSGYVVRFALASSAPSVSYLTGVLVAYQYDSFNGTAAAKIVKEDGTTSVYPVAKIEGQAQNVPPLDASVVFAGVGVGGDDPELPYAYFVQYTVGDDGKVTLKKVTTYETLKDQGGGKYYEAGKAQIVGTNKKLYMTSSTKIFYVDTMAAVSGDNTVKVLTGYAKAPAVTEDVKVYYVAAAGNADVVSAVLFDKTMASVAPTPTTKYVFATPALSVPTMVKEGTTTYYYYDVYVDGKVTTIKSEADDLFETGDVIVAGLYALKDTDGVYELDDSDDKISTPDAADGNNETRIVDPGYIVLKGGDVITLTEKTKFYRYEADNSEEEVYESAIAASTNYVHYKVINYLEDAQDNAVAVYFTLTID